MILVFTIVDRYIEVWARKTYGPYAEPVKEASP
jgi:tetrahydromethanopterin S-methyltransferase subunit E